MKTGVSRASLRGELRADSNRLATSLMAAHGLGLTVIGGFLWAGWVGVAQSEPETGWRLLDSLRPGILLWVLFVSGFAMASLSHLLRLFGLTILIGHRPGRFASRIRKGRRMFWGASSGLIDMLKIWSGMCLALALALVTLMAVAAVVVANEHRTEAATTAQATPPPAVETPQTAVPETKDGPRAVVAKEVATGEPWPVQAILLCTLLAGAGLGVAVVGGRHVWRVHRTRWWDLSVNEPNGPLEWDHVRKLMSQDPVSFRSGWRLCPKFLLWEIPLALGIGTALWAAAQLVISNDVSAENLEHVGVGIGGLGIFLAFLGVLHTNRVSTRSTNRQAWINDLRSELADIIQALPQHEPGETVEDPGKVQAARAKVELMLNPSERDHRALLALLRHFFGYEGIGIDQEARSELGLRPREWVDPETRMRRKSEVIRLINAVLKREWEQVKHAR